MVDRVHRLSHLHFSFEFVWFDGFTKNDGGSVLARLAISARWFADKEQSDRNTSVAVRGRAHPNDQGYARFVAIRQRVLPSSEILKEVVPKGT